MEKTNALTYLNTAACGLMDEEVIQVGTTFLNELRENSSDRSERWRDIDSKRIRTTIADFLHVKPHNVAVIPNFSWALNAIVQSLDSRSTVMLYRHDYPSVLDPFRINNFNIHWIDSADGFHLPVDEITEAITTKAIDVLTISHIQFNSGYKLDIAAIAKLCRENDVLFIVDATQSMGATPLNLSYMDIDVLISSNYKWMNAGFGTGILYMSDRFLQDHIPVVGGHNSYQMINGNWQYVPSVYSYEPGHPNIIGQLVLEAGIHLKLRMGLQQIEEHNMSLTTMLLERLKKHDLDLTGPYNTDNRGSFIVLKDVNGLFERLKNHNVITTIRNGVVRISMHYYNREADLDRLEEAILAR